MGIVEAVSRSAEYTFAKPTCDGIRLPAGLGVEDDVHHGVTVKHPAPARMGRSSTTGLTP